MVARPIIKVFRDMTIEQIRSFRGPRICPTNCVLTAVGRFFFPLSPARAETPGVVECNPRRVLSPSGGPWPFGMMARSSGTVLSGAKLAAKMKLMGPGITGWVADHGRKNELLWEQKVCALNVWVRRTTWGAFGGWVLDFPYPVKHLWPASSETDG